MLSVSALQSAASPTAPPAPPPPPPPLTQQPPALATALAHQVAVVAPPTCIKSPHLTTASMNSDYEGETLASPQCRGIQTEQPGSAPITSGTTGFRLNEPVSLVPCEWRGDFSFVQAALDTVENTQHDPRVPLNGVKPPSNEHQLGNAHDWDIKNIKQGTVTVFDPYDIWPDGHVRRIYNYANERARRHQSGWAMRNTNNHNPQVLKKSCLGVLECSAKCRPNGKAYYLRPAICDKARRKQCMRRCITEGCDGHLVQRVCKGHGGYPVTHFWRFANSAVYFEAKGRHDHPRPALKSFGAHQDSSLPADLIDLMDSPNGQVTTGSLTDSAEPINTNVVPPANPLSRRGKEIGSAFKAFLPKTQNLLDKPNSGSRDKRRKRNRQVTLDPVSEATACNYTSFDLGSCMPNPMDLFRTPLAQPAPTPSMMMMMPSEETGLCFVAPQQQQQQSQTQTHMNPQTICEYVTQSNNAVNNIGTRFQNHNAHNAPPIYQQQQHSEQQQAPGWSLDIYNLGASENQQQKMDCSDNSLDESFGRCVKSDAQQTVNGFDVQELLHLVDQQPRTTGNGWEAATTAPPPQHPNVYAGQSAKSLIDQAHEASQLDQVQNPDLSAHSTVSFYQAAAQAAADFYYNAQHPVSSMEAAQSSSDSSIATLDSTFPQQTNAQSLMFEHGGQATHADGYTLAWDGMAVAAAAVASLQQHPTHYAPTQYCLGLEESNSHGQMPITLPQC